MGRKLDRRRRKKALQRGEMIPGVPALHTGGTATFLHQLTEHGVASPGFGEGQAPPPPPRGGIPSRFTEVSPGQFIDFETGESFTIPQPGAGAGGGGGGGAAPQFRPGELDLLREQFEFEQESFQLDLELRRLQEQHANAIAQGNLDLARQTEARIDRIQTQQLQLEQRRLQLDASLGRAQGISGLASSRGQIEAQRAAELARLAANPRDFAQLDIAQGGGQSVISQLLRNQQVGGRSSALIGDTPTLGADFQRLLQSITARPDIPLFDEAADLFRNVPQFAKGGTQVVTDEPIVGIGAISGRPRFTLGEPAPGFPQGKPEKLEVTPLQEGGTVATGPGQDAFLKAIGGSPKVQNILAGVNQPPAPTFEEQFGFPSFPGLDQLIRFLDLGSGLGQSIQNFGQGGSDVFNIARSARDFQESIPRSQGAAIRQLMSGLNQQTLGRLLPSDVGLLESVISALAVPPEDFFQSLMRTFPTGPNPASVSFGNFAEGGTIIAGVGARPVAA